MALNKNPKADLKRKYQRYWEISLIISLTMVIVAFKFFPEFKQEVLDIDAPQELIMTEDVELQSRKLPHLHLQSLQFQLKHRQMMF